jgi:hypothetical protein
MNAPSGNRTQGISMATRYFTTKPMVQLLDVDPTKISILLSAGVIIPVLHSCTPVPGTGIK